MGTTHAFCAVLAYIMAEDFSSLARNRPRARNCGDDIRQPSDSKLTGTGDLWSISMISDEHTKGHGRGI